MDFIPRFDRPGKVDPLRRQKEFRAARDSACRNAREERDRREANAIARSAAKWAKIAAIIAIIAIIITAIIAHKEIVWLVKSVISRCFLLP